MITAKILSWLRKIYEVEKYLMFCDVQNSTQDVMIIFVHVCVQILPNSSTRYFTVFVFGFCQ